MSVRAVWLRWVVLAARSDRVGLGFDAIKMGVSGCCVAGYKWWRSARVWRADA